VRLHERRASGEEVSGADELEPLLPRELGGGRVEALMGACAERRANR
jgi:hypothetical protein